jgi:hypothetical protein
MSAMSTMPLPSTMSMYKCLKCSCHQCRGRCSSVCLARRSIGGSQGYHHGTVPMRREFSTLAQHERVDGEAVVADIIGMPQTTVQPRAHEIIPDLMKIKNINELINISCEKYAELPAFGTLVGDKYEWMTYKEFGEQIQRMRNVLVHHNILKNDKIALISNNRVEWAVAFYAASSLGAQLVPM